MKVQEPEDRFDKYLSETLKASVKSTEQLAEESFALWQAEQRETAKPALQFPVRWMSALALAACLILGVVYLSVRNSDMVHVHIAQLNLSTYRGGTEDVIREKLLAQRSHIVETYEKKVEGIAQPIKWHMAYSIEQQAQGGLRNIEVVVTVTARNRADVHFEIRRSYASPEDLIDGLITLEADVISGMLDEVFRPEE